MKTKLILDVHKAQYAQLNSMVMGRVGDKASNTVDVYVVDGFVPYNLTGSDVYFECAKPDNTSVRDKNGIVMIDAAKGHFEYTFPAQTFAAIGKSKQAYFSIEKNSTVKATTQDFIIVSIPDALTNRIPSQTYISQLEELIWQLEQIELDLLNSAAYQEAHDAKIFAEQAKSISESVKAQLDQIVIQGSIDPETKQARVDDNGIVYPLLKERLDAEQRKVSYLEEIAVNVKEFKKPQDGTDDAPSLKRAFDFANAKKIPVIIKQNDIYIKSALGIDIKTDVDFGYTNIHIDESILNGSKPVFNVPSSFSEINVTSVVSGILPYLKKGSRNIPPLSNYPNSIVKIVDSTTKVGARNNPDTTGWDMTDYIYVDQNGGIVGEITWDFTNVTSVIVKQCDKQYLKVKGGNIILSGTLGGGVVSGNYSKPIFKIDRSRTIFDMQFVGFEGVDNATQPFGGVLDYNFCYDLNIKNTRAVPRKLVVIGGGPVGTYGIVMSGVVNATLDNVTSISDNSVWGLTGTNLVKNLTIKNSNLNRIDCHFHAWNVTIRDTYTNRIALTGGGKLLVDNVTTYDNNLVEFRPDYGSKWDGDITINNSKIVPSNPNSDVAILNFMPNINFDYLYDISFGTNIKINGVEIDYSQVNMVNPTNIILTPNSSKTASRRIKFPSSIECKNISVSGREKGIEKGIRLTSPLNFKLGKQGGIVNSQIKTNCLIRFENVQFEEKRGVNLFDFNAPMFMLNGLATDIYPDDYSLYPKVEFINCNEVFISTSGLIADVYIENCVINAINAYSGGAGRSIYRMDHCTFQSNLLDDGSALCRLNTVYGTFLTNCIINAPVLGGTVQPAKTHLYDVVDFSSSGAARYVRYNHLNTKLGSNIYPAPYNLETWYLAGLKSHTDIENQYINRKSGLTSQRPNNASLLVVGDNYFDTDLNSLLTWNGTQWFNAIGVQPSENTNWTGLTTSFGTVTGRPMRYKKVNGIVTVTGSVANATNITRFATLPVGFRPPQSVVFSAFDQTGGKAIELTIWDNGELSLNHAAANATVHITATFLV
ncbi:TPA: BppU family phage baseplate upper protein [Bacillus cereus]|nr:BppU family phage baseplate upper protein [Bacillus cereus]